MEQNEILTLKMIAILTFPIIAAALVLLAGRRDSARDPQLTFILLVLLAILPTMVVLMPKIEVFPSSAAVAQTEFSWMTAIIVLWTVGFVFALGKILLAGFLIARWQKESTHIETVDGVSIRILEGLRSPVAAGVFRKTVFVPSGWNEMATAPRKIILAHELSHHRRHDPLWRLCVEIVRAVHWYNPLVHWMARRYVMQSECACDESVLGNGIDAKTYASVLCDCAETHHPNSFALAMADTSSLEKRVGRILAGKNHTGTLLLTVLGVLGLTAACALSMLGGEPSVDATEVQLRFSANPFPGEG